MSPPVRVVVADDSPFVRGLLTSFLQSSPDLHVVGAAADGDEAIELVRRLRPDVVTLDVEMPGTSGLDALRAIMADCPTPALMVSGVSREAAEVTLRALKIGAVDFILKYTPGIDTKPEALRREIVSKVKAAARPRPAQNRRRPAPQVAPEPLFPGPVIVIGASTGGPTALRELLDELPADFPAPVLVVQHLPESFTEALVVQLDRQLPLRVQQATQGALIRGETVFIAPGGRHLLVGRCGRLELNDGPKVGGHRPSIDVTMQSAAQRFGGRTIGVLLTGMGDDGASGLAFIRAKAGRTFAQDAASCVVNGMPRRAAERGVVDQLAPPGRIGQLIRDLVVPGPGGSIR